MSRKNLLSYIFSIVILSSCEFYPQDDSLFLYYPLQVGNKWQFKSSEGYTWTRDIIGDTIFNGKKYSVIIDSTGPYHYSETHYQRVDSLTFNIYRSNPYYTFEIIIDSLKASVGDTIWQPIFINSEYIPKAFYDSLLYDTVLSVPTYIRYLSEPVIPDWPTFGFAKGFGLVYYRYTVEDPIYPRYYPVFNFLQYARINGAEFGILLDVKDQKLQSNSFNLSQNYPNPFNSQTRIEYQISNESFVTLKIFDILGREVETLVHSFQKPGQHSLNYSASGLSSGIYFLVMEADNYSQTIKMVYLK